MKTKFQVLMVAAGCSLAAVSLAFHAISPAIAQESQPTSATQMVAQSTSDLTSIIGHYVVDGKNPDGTTYVGVAWIQPGAEGTVRVDWSLELPQYGGFSSFVGTGRFDADRTLNVTYAGTLDGSQTFTMNPDGTLTASYTDPTGTGTERFIPVEQVIRR